MHTCIYIYMCVCMCEVGYTYVYIINGYLYVRMYIHMYAPVDAYLHICGPRHVLHTGAKITGGARH